MSKKTANINPKIGDVFSLVRNRFGENTVEKVKIERITQAQAHDTMGRAWWLKDGSRVGASSKASEWSSIRYDRLVPWTSEHEAALAAQSLDKAVTDALDVLNRLHRTAGHETPKARAALRRALPSLQAAVAALADPNE